MLGASGFKVLGCRGLGFGALRFKGVWRQPGSLGFRSEVRLMWGLESRAAGLGLSVRFKRSRALSPETPNHETLKSISETRP